MARCMNCGGAEFTDEPVLWDELSDTWELSAEERAYVDRQQGTRCVSCRANLRSSALAQAITSALGIDATLREAVGRRETARLEVLEINEAGNLSAELARLPGHTFGCYPDVDMQALPYTGDRFDLVVHSDTLEHVPDPLAALAECRRVLKPGGALCFTIPIIVGRLSRSCEGRPATYHGPPGSGEDYRVVTEFGADAWTACLRVGFSSVSICAVEYPAGLALIARKGVPSRADGTRWRWLGLR